MTNKEAIEQLQSRVDYAKSFEHSDADFVSVEALELAIKALEERPQGKMLIKINPETYIKTECIEAVQTQITYLGDYEDGGHKKKIDTVIYTRSGRKFYYDGTVEECLKELEMTESGCSRYIREKEEADMGGVEE